MKNILIITGAAVASLYIAKMVLDKTDAMPSRMRSMDTKGREIIFNMNKNGYLVDQYGGQWA